MKCECDNCDWTGDQSEVVPLGEGDRGPCELTPGTEVPAGECPKCGVWAYIVKESEPTTALDALRELRAALMGTDLATGYIYAADRKRIEIALADAGCVLMAAETRSPDQTHPQDDAPTKSLSGAAPGLLEACKELIENIEGKGAAMTMHELYLLNRWGPTITAAEQPEPAKI